MISRDIKPEHTKLILTEMCSRVGVKYEDFDFNQPDWFMKYSWTAEEEESYRVWLGKKLVEWKYVGKGKYRGQNHGYYEAGKLVFNYGWRTK